MIEETLLTDLERQKLKELITTAVVAEPADRAGNRRRHAWLALLRKIDGVDTVVLARRG